MRQDVSADMAAAANLDMREGLRHHLSMRTIFRVECFDKDGHLKWIEEVPNLIVNEGLDDILDKYLKGSAYTASFFVGLIDDAGFDVLSIEDDAAGIVDTSPTSGSNGWGELTEYDEANRQTLTLGTVAQQSVDNSASKASFSINASVTVNGAFVVTNNTKLATAGVLYGEASFASPRSAANGDTLNVTVTLTAASG